MKIKITCSVQEFEHIAKFFSSGEEVKQVATPFTVTTNTKEVKPSNIKSKPSKPETKQTTPDVFTNLNWKEEQENPKKKKTEAPKIIENKPEEKKKLMPAPKHPKEYYDSLKVGTLPRKIDVFQGSEEKGFILVYSAESLTDASKYVKTSYPSNISKYVDSGKVYNNQWKFISRKK